jgi:hypothetical protein
MIPKAMDALPIPISEGSRMAADRDAAPELLNLPSSCEHYLGGSEDLLLALVHLMQPGPNTLQLPRFALYPLIRGVIESSGQVAWVLGPDDRRDRFRRLLQVEKGELDYDVKYVDVLTRPRADDSPAFRSLSAEQRRLAEVKRRLRWQRLLDGAAVLGIEQGDFQHGVRGGYESIVREAADEQGLDGDFHGRQCASVWMFVSGLCHPSMSRAWGGSINEPGDVGSDGYMTVWSEADPVVVRDALQVAIGLHLRASILWRDACVGEPRTRQP